MDWSSIIAALITGGLAFLGVWVSNRKSGALIAYRIEQLERKQDRYNNLQERTYKLEERAEVHEEKIKVANNRIADLEKKVEI